MLWMLFMMANGLLSSKKMRGICVPHEPAKPAAAQ